VHHPGTFSALNSAGFFSGALRTLKVSARSAQVDTALESQ